jgi:hypothetical protein
MRAFQTFLLPLMAVLAGCTLLPLPTNQPEVPPPAAGDFNNVLTAQPATAAANVPASAAGGGGFDPFSDTSFKNVDTATKFAPVFKSTVDPLEAGATPSVTTDIYQTKSELEARQVNTLIEGASFHFEKLKVGLQVGSGQADVGTPPKLSVPIEVKVEDTDSSTYAVLSVKSNSALAKIYVGDLQVKVLFGSLSIVSIANASRANDKDDVHTLPASLRVVQKLDAGYVQLPAKAGPMRTRMIITSEPDPTTNVAGQRVFNETLTVKP